MSAIASIQDISSYWPEGYASKKQESSPACTSREDVLTISEEGREAARRYAEAQAKGMSTSELGQKYENGNLNSETWRKRETANYADGEGLTVTSAQETVVNVSHSPAASIDGKDMPSKYTAQVTRKDGLQVEFELTGNVRINDREDGSLAILYAGTGETHVYGPDGAKSVFKGEAGALQGTASNDIFINLNGSTVDGGAGDDTIINFADNAHLQGGDGNDTIILGREVAGNSIDTGDGNDTLLGVGARDSVVHMGAGDNAVGLDVFEGASEMTLGDGNNSVSIAAVGSGIRANTVGLPDTVLKMGNGNNVFTSFGAGINSKIYIGDGDNTVKSNSIAGLLRVGDGDNALSLNSVKVGDSLIAQAYGTSRGYTGTQVGGIVELGNGNNVVDIKDVSYGSSVQAGNGSNVINVDNLSYNSTIQAGSGSNVINVDNLSYNSTIQAGSGNNKVHVDSLDHKGDIEVGDGNNEIMVRSANGPSIKMGGGSNTLYWDSASNMEVQTGNGNNRLVGRALSSGNIETGSGHDQIEIFQGSGSTIRSGDGNDTIGLGYLRGQVQTGEGDNTVTALGSFISVHGGTGITTIQGNPYLLNTTGNVNLQRGESAMVRALRESFAFYQSTLFSDDGPNSLLKM